MADLTAKLKEITSKIAQLEGQKEMLMSRLQQDFGVHDIQSGKSLLEQLEHEHTTLCTTYDREHREFMDKYGDKL